jgi:hypothetical protein
MKNNVWVLVEKILNRSKTLMLKAYTDKKFPDSSPNNETDNIIKNW